MPKHRPMAMLKKIGHQIRARRLHLGHTREFVANGAGISITQLSAYENGQGSAPATTLHRIAVTLGTSTSELLGETMAAENAEQVDEMMQIYAHPVVGAVVRCMCEMSRSDLASLKVIAAAFAARHRECLQHRQTSNQTNPVG